jgi:hypothetical protein
MLFADTVESTLGLLAVSSSTALLPLECHCASLAPSSSTGLTLRLLDLFTKELVMLATLSLRIIDEAEERTRCSLRALVVMPGNGSESRLHTSVIKASSRARSLRGGASMGTRCVAIKERERLMERTAEPSLPVSRTALVFFTMTWHNGDLGPTVVARWIDNRRATVPGFPKTVPRLLMLRSMEPSICETLASGSSAYLLNRIRHSISSFAVQAVMMTSCN